MHQNTFFSEGSRSFARLITIDIRTNTGNVAFTHTSEKNSLKETVELFLRNNSGVALENIDLSNLDLAGVNLNNASFKNSKFDGSVFYSSEICKSILHFSTDLATNYPRKNKI